MNCSAIAIFAVVVLATPISTLADPIDPPGKYLIEPFDYHDVVLTDGPLLRQVADVRDDYLRIPNDDLLKGFRRRAGKPAPGVDLGGWYGDDIFLIFGQIISGLSRMYAATGDEACRLKVDTLVSEWGQCIAPDGYFYFSNKPNAPHYTYDKMVGGLVDAYHYAGNQEALGYLSRITDWAIKNLDRANVYAFNAFEGSTEWYTLSENLYRAWLFTGDEQYRDFAKVWEFKDYWDTYAAKGDIFQRARLYHAYSHVNTLSGAGAAYRATGEAHYLDTLRNAYDYLQENQCFATGGYGPIEQLAPPELLLQYLDTQSVHFETQCGSWAGFKLAKYLMCLTGDARYGDWIERLLINGIGATVPMTPDGRVMYYSGYSLTGAAKHNNDTGWSCCAGTRPQAVADYHDLIYFHDTDGLYVNLFTASRVSWESRGSWVSVSQETRFPDEAQTRLRVICVPDVEFPLHIRVPGWLGGPILVKVNDAVAEAKPSPQHWLTLRRTWGAGDLVSIELPMRFDAPRFPASSAAAFPAAVCYGPVVLAFRASGGNPCKQIDFQHLDRSLIPSPGEPLTYHLAAAPDVLVRPFYAFKEGEPYFLYFDPAKAWTRIGHERLTYSPQWRIINDMHVSTEPGAFAECSFEGTAVRWIGRKYDDSAMTQITVDGKDLVVVDQYDPRRGVPFAHEVRDLQPGRHTIRLTLLADKNPASKDRYANIIAMDVMSADAVSPPAP
jgi:uncharacterized protein